MYRPDKQDHVHKKTVTGQEEDWSDTWNDGTGTQEQDGMTGTTVLLMEAT